jgi:hypothetical protein
MPWPASSTAAWPWPSCPVAAEAQPPWRCACAPKPRMRCGGAHAKPTTPGTPVGRSTRRPPASTGDRASCRDAPRWSWPTGASPVHWACIWWHWQRAATVFAIQCAGCGWVAMTTSRRCRAWRWPGLRWRSASGQRDLPGLQRSGQRTPRVELSALRPDPATSGAAVDGGRQLVGHPAAWIRAWQQPRPAQLSAARGKGLPPTPGLPVAQNTLRRIRPPRDRPLRLKAVRKGRPMVKRTPTTALSRRHDPAR